MHRRLGSILLTLVAAAGCQIYDPPPEAALRQPEGGAFVEGETAFIEFSEPIDEDSLRIRLWPNVRDIEGEIAADTEPVVELCLVGEDCGDFSVSLSADRKLASLEFGDELGKPGSPLIIDVLPGLRDDDGNDTVSHHTFDMQFRVSEKANEEPIEFDEGVYIILAQVEQPIPTVITLISDVRVLPDGRFALVGAEGDEINGAPKNTADPENLEVDSTDRGYTVYADGFIALTDDGKRLLETEPRDLMIPLGPLEIYLTNMRLFAEVVEDPETGQDRLDGTLSFDALRLVNGDNETEQVGGSTAFIADRVPDELVPPGTPTLCGDLCGNVVGLCDPPAEFPPAEFCGSM